MTVYYARARDDGSGANNTRHSELVSESVRMAVMAIKLESTKFGRVTINGKAYPDVLLVGDKIILRNLERLHRKYGTAHIVPPEELDQLLEAGPEVLVIGAGQQGLLQVDSCLKEMAKEAGVSLIIKRTPLALREYQRLVAEGKKVNALIHVTC